MEQEIVEEVVVEQEDEAGIFFRRFPKEKQDQVRGLVEYATLMGLTGKDLVSIGGKLDRIKDSQERIRNMEIVKSFDCLPIGDDAKRGKGNHEYLLDTRFKLKTVNGSYNFHSSSYSGWTITSAATKQRKHHNPGYGDHALPRSLGWERHSRYSMLLDIASGKLLLNF